MKTLRNEIKSGQIYNADPSGEGSIYSGIDFRYTGSLGEGDQVTLYPLFSLCARADMIPPGLLHLPSTTRPRQRMLWAIQDAYRGTILCY